MDTAAQHPDPAFPRFHPRPAQGWINDPNGLGYADGRFHVFFQYNPDSARHQGICWGHLSSPDLVRWDEEPVALRPQPGGPDALGCWSGRGDRRRRRPHRRVLRRRHRGRAIPAWSWPGRTTGLRTWTQDGHVAAEMPPDPQVTAVRDPFLFTLPGPPLRPPGRRAGLRPRGRAALQRRRPPRLEVRGDLVQHRGPAGCPAPARGDLGVPAAGPGPGFLRRGNLAPDGLAVARGRTTTTTPTASATSSARCRGRRRAAGVHPGVGREGRPGPGVLRPADPRAAGPGAALGLVRRGCGTARGPSRAQPGGNGRRRLGRGPDVPPPALRARRGPRRRTRGRTPRLPRRTGCHHGAAGTLALPRRGGGPGGRGRGRDPAGPRPREGSGGPFSPTRWPAATSSGSSSMPRSWRSTATAPCPPPCAPTPARGGVAAGTAARRRGGRLGTPVPAEG